MKKKIFTLLLIIVLVVSLPQVIFAESQTSTQQTVHTKIDVYINNEYKEFSITPVLLNKKILMVPLEETMSQIGADVVWDEEQDIPTAYIYRDETACSIQRGNKLSWINDELVKMEYSPKIIYGKMYIPASYLSQAFDAEIIWNDKDYTLEINIEAMG